MKFLATASSLGLLLSSCLGPPPDRLVAPIEEASVRPDINANFLEASVKVEEFIERFESETREVAMAREAIVDGLNLRRGMEVADVGAGTGLFLEALSERVGQSGRVYALDISPAFIDHLEERVHRERLDPPVQTKMSREKSVDLVTRSIDLAFVCDTYHHFEYPKSMLWSIFRALRPGGTLVVVDFERIPGESREWILDHMRADKETFTAEIEQAGFVFEEEVEIDGLFENYFLRFRRP